MATNGPLNSQTFTSPASTSVPAKRKGSARKTPAAARPDAPARKSAPGPVEIVFKELPNPFRQPEPPYIWIDFPQQGDRLTGPDYVIRLGVGGAEMVELTIDKSDWIPCRYASGYWWYDWTNIPAGKHTLVARMKTTDGRWFKTPPRSCDRRS